MNNKKKIRNSTGNCHPKTFLKGGITQSDFATIQVTL